MYELPPEWETWLRRHWPKLVGTPWEATFARTVLSRVPGLAPECVEPQFAFCDLRGGARRIDFAVLQGARRIAIEVDGWDKTGRGAGMSREEFEDWSLRETSLAADGWNVLRFANSLVGGDPDYCVRVLHRALFDVDPSWIPPLPEPVLSPRARRQPAARRSPAKSTILDAVRRRAIVVAAELVALAVTIVAVVLGLNWVTRGTQDMFRPERPATTQAPAAPGAQVTRSNAPACDLENLQPPCVYRPPKKR